MSQSSAPKHSVAVEDYIKQIWKLQRRGEHPTTKAIADRLDLGRGTVSGMLRHLAERGLIIHRRYHGVRLTEEGERLALRMVRRHRLLELFLVKTLKLGWDEVDRDAERLEHAVSDELIERIDQVLGHPDVDPHGAPIPDASGGVEDQHYRTLADLRPGESGRIRRVSDSDPEFLKHLTDLGLELDTTVEVLDTEPFGGLRVRIDAGTEAHLPREATRRIYLSID